MTETPENETVELSAAEAEALIADAPAEDKEAFVPTDAAGVDWVLSKAAAARAEAKLLRENMEKMARACERRAEYLEWKYGAAIQTWLNAALLEGGKGSANKNIGKSQRLPHGVVGYRTRPAGVTVTNPAAAREWARVHLPAAVVETLDKKALTARLVETGESLDFAAFQRAEQVFYIK